MMNYASSPFQDYESITIDELKDQANSLLNLVTEEQRQLRVCMNNGKEFLLFPQDLLAPICDSDFRLIDVYKRQLYLSLNVGLHAPALTHSPLTMLKGRKTVEFPASLVVI